MLRQSKILGRRQTASSRRANRQCPSVLVSYAILCQLENCMGGCMVEQDRGRDEAGGKLPRAEAHRWSRCALCATYLGRCGLRSMPTLCRAAQSQERRARGEPKGGAEDTCLPSSQSARRMGRCHCCPGGRLFTVVEVAYNSCSVYRLSAS